MASLNKKTPPTPIFTHGGAKATKISPENELRRSVFSTFLWESNFYEDGQTIADRITSLVPKVDPKIVSEIAIEARLVHNLRHVPLLIVCAMAKFEDSKPYVAETLEKVICRADELTEFLAIYWKNGKVPLANSVKKGLAKAFTKFNEYQLSRNNQDKDIKLRDVLFLCHAKPKDEEQANLWKRMINNELKFPDSWEVELSQSKNKTESWTRLIEEKKLGGLATLKNIRNMSEANLSKELIVKALDQGNYSQVLPFRFISAAIHNPKFEDCIETTMLKNFSTQTKIPGKTILVVDMSGSMVASISSKSDMNRLDAAFALSIIIREVCEDVVIYATAGNDGTRIHKTSIVPARHGFALRDSMKALSPKIGGGGIFLKQCLDYVFEQEKITDETKPDRLIVFTDEQDCDVKANPDTANAFAKNNYIINISSNQNGIAYKKFTHVNGFSEGVVKYIAQSELKEN